MKVYVKKKNKKYWHWELECPNYPEIETVDKIYLKPEKEKLCSICLQIEARGKNIFQNKDISGDDYLI